MNADAAAQRAEEAARRAGDAAQLIMSDFGHRLLGIPGTWLARVERPHPRPQLPWSEWHYWWQAQLLDCLVDAALREHATGHATARGDMDAFTLAQRLLRAIWARNFGRFENLFFDDMAWLALAASRLDRLARDLGGAGLLLARRASRRLGARLEAGATPDLGGGMWWNTKRHYKNTAATGPAALFFARRFGQAGDPRDRERAQALIDWLCGRLLDPEMGLFLDGIDVRHDQAGRIVTTVNRDVWTYNQGPILGALLELGGEHAHPGGEHAHPGGEHAHPGGERAHPGGEQAEPGAEHRNQHSAEPGETEPSAHSAAPGNLGRAAALIAAVDRGLASDGSLQPDGTAGDAALFRGILTRYLALAAVDARLPEPTRATARRLVLATAQSAWADTARRCSGTLSARLDIWMVLEAAWRTLHDTEGN